MFGIGLAIAGIGALISGGTGIASSVEGKKMSEKAEAQAKRTNDLAEKKFQFAEKVYNRFQKTFGVTEQNYANYINTLTPDSLAARRTEQWQLGYQNAIESVKANYAVRGLKGSGAELATLSRMAFEASRQRAQIRQSAEDDVWARKRDWIGVGAQRYGFVTDTMNKAHSDKLQVSANRESYYNQEAARLNKDAKSAFANIGGQLMGVGGTLASANIKKGNTGTDTVKETPQSNYHNYQDSVSGSNNPSTGVSSPTGANIKTTPDTPVYNGIGNFNYGGDSSKVPKIESYPKNPTTEQLSRNRGINKANKNAENLERTYHKEGIPKSLLSSFNVPRFYKEK